MAMYGEYSILMNFVENQEEAKFRLQTTKDGHPTKNHPVTGRFEHCPAIEQKYLPKDMMDERYNSTEGFGAKGFQRKDVL